MKLLAAALIGLCSSFAHSATLPAGAPFKILVAAPTNEGITQGQGVNFNDSNGTLVGAVSKDLIDLRYDSFDQSVWWQFEFQPSTGRVLKSGGVYAKAVRYPFNDHGPGTSKINGIDISSTGIGCNDINGDFRVQDLSFDAAGGVKHVALTFQQTCDHASTSLVGSLEVGPVAFAKPSATLSKFVGTYEGSIINTDAVSRPALLSVYLVNVRDGVNPDGTIRIRPALMSRFQYRDVVLPTDYASMQGVASADGQVKMASNDGAISMSGLIIGEQATVDVSTAGGLLGQFSGQRTSTNVNAPTGSDAIELRERMRAQLEALEGVYSGVVETASERVPVQLSLVVQEGTSGTPVLTALYRRLDMPAGIGDRALTITFDPLHDRVSGSSDGTFSLSGTWTAGALDVVFRDQHGFAGELKATRKPLR